MISMLHVLFNLDGLRTMHNRQQFRRQIFLLYCCYLIGLQQQHAVAVCCRTTTNSAYTLTIITSPGLLVNVTSCPVCYFGEDTTVVYEVYGPIENCQLTVNDQTNIQSELNNAALVEQHVTPGQYCNVTITIPCPRNKTDIVYQIATTYNHRVYNSRKTILQGSYCILPPTIEDVVFTSTRMIITWNPAADTTEESNWYSVAILFNASFTVLLNTSNTTNFLAVPIPPQYYCTANYTWVNVSVTHHVLLSADAEQHLHSPPAVVSKKYSGPQFENNCITTTYTTIKIATTTPSDLSTSSDTITPLPTEDDKRSANSSTWTTELIAILIGVCLVIAIIVVCIIFVFGVIYHLHKKQTQGHSITSQNLSPVTFQANGSTQDANNEIME